MTNDCNGTREELRRRWHTLLNDLSVDQRLAEELFNDLVKHYDGDGRHYHNLEHVLHLLTVIEDLSDLANDPVAVELAAWYHDVIYQIGEPDNEARSAEFASEALRRMRVDQERVEHVQKMIRSTKLNHSPPDDPDHHILLDADLSTLASDQKLYDENTRAIRQEFSSVPDEYYRLGRIDILNGFLQRDRIYLTDRMYDKMERKARANIERELALLS